ncbi:MAG: protein kinase [Kofleriaceae bacterium]
MVGSQLGAYRVLSQIGVGGMGVVWLAEHTMLGRRAAIKVLHPMFTAQPEVVSRFFNEARAATQISDPGIVQIFDFGHHTDGSAYIAMELLEGETLERRRQRLGRLPVTEALRILRQISSTLGVAHARGIVHRDLKPENIFLVPDPEVIGGERSKVLDFGIAKLTGEGGVKTHTSAVLGTPTYMSPEQCRGAGHVDQRADVYALGCVLFTLLTGRPPFEAEGSGELIAMHLREAPPAPSSRVPGIPPEVDALVLRCLSKDPAQRFPSGSELAIELGRLAGTPTHLPSFAPSPSPTEGPLPLPASAVTTLSSGTGAALLPPAAVGRRRSWIAGVVTLSLGLGVMIGVIKSREDAPRALESAVIPTPETPGTPLGSVIEVTPTAASVTPTELAPSVEDRPAEVSAEPTEKPEEDPTAALAAQMKLVLGNFIVWAGAHPGEPCPSISALGQVPSDPWGTALVVTCTDQPANQVAGVISAGPDTKLGTPDDRGSWQLDQDVTELVHGPRWVVKAAPPKPPPVKRTRRLSDNDIPTER